MRLLGFSSWAALGAALSMMVSCASRPVVEDDWFERHARSHREVDAALARGQAREAVTMLQTTLTDRAPVGVDAEAIAVVRKDVLFRLADIHLAQSDHAAALAAAERGLSMSITADVFTVNLYIVQGRALEGLRRTKEAAAVYRAALLMTEGMLDASLPEP